MKNYILGVVFSVFFVGCAHEHQINIGEISLIKHTTPVLKNQEYYMSFTQEYYDNKLYPLSQYCDDKRNYLVDDKFSTETYLKVLNERTKQTRVGKYPIWFLLNDDSLDIACVRKSANFINAEPFVVNSNDNLSVKLLQKNEAERKVPVQELSILMDFVSLVVPRTANFLLKTNNIIKDPIAQNYLNIMDEAFRHGDLDGTKSKDFNTNTSSVKVKLYVPSKKESKRELGYILLKPKYRSTLSTVTTNNGIPNFRFIYNSSDPQIEDLMQYELKKRHVRLQVVVDNFRQVATEHLIEALASLNTNLKNCFTRFDRALILNLALRQSDFYRKFSQSVRNKDFVTLQKYMTFLNNKHNPLNYLTQELNVTQCEYATLITKAKQLIEHTTASNLQAIAEAQRIKNERSEEQVKMQGIENFFSPVSNWKYLPQMFTKELEIVKTTGEHLTLDMLTKLYDRESKVSDYGCYVDLQKLITVQVNSRTQKQGVTVQNYLIHPNYTKGVQYDYMAISVNKQSQIDTILYKFSKKGNLRIEKILIDSSNLFINKSRIREIIKGKRSYSCSENIRRLF